jgi:hypothetical protein
MNGFDSPGKTKARALVVEVFASEGGTVLDFYGGGRSAAAFVEAGLTVTSAEIDRSLHERLLWDSAIHGYEPFLGRASRIKRDFDHVFADFTGGPSPKTRRELRLLASRTTKWLAVTLSPDRQLDEVMIGPSSSATVPAWLIEETGMRLEYISRYIRNEYRQWMWIALLRPRGHKHGSGQQVDSLTVAREIQRRRYWASPYFRSSFTELVPHRRHSETDSERARSKWYYETNRDTYLARSRAGYYANREKRLAQQKAWNEANPEKAKAAQKRWRDRNPDYQKSDERKAYRRAYYLANRDKAIAQAKAYRESKKAA